MKLTKIFVPMLAIVFAIGMSFATERATTDPVSDYIDKGDGQPTAIMEVDNCGDRVTECFGRLPNDLSQYQIYDGPGLTNPKEGAGDVIDITEK